MSTNTTTVAEQQSPLGFRLGRRARRAVLTAHIIAAGSWIGIDVVLAVLVFTARLTGSTATQALCYEALALFAVWPLLTAGVASLVTGVVLGLGTKYGLVRYRWVTVKLVINVALVTLIALALRPAVAEAARYGRALAAGQPTDAAVDKLVMPPIVSSVALVTATILSVYKPWGRTRRSANPAVRSSPT
jgi:hypothetical protein